ncbi:siderophore-interacting protein [Actinomadura yumaensis]|uniref:Siderophore-interacting protein n=1 Tax=Actinomadura yumaensis TaxID=111807 RepID=A0ABW2CMA1_9ACTN
MAANAEQTAGPGTGAIRGRLLDLMFTRGRVEEVRSLTPRMRLVRVGGVPGLSWRPGQHVRLHVADLLAARTWLSGAIRDILRTYSVWAYDPDAGVLDLCVYDHDGASSGTDGAGGANSEAGRGGAPGGPGARWAREARPGQEVVFGGPEGGFTLKPAPYHLFVGEETASVAFGAMLRAVPPDEGVYGAIEVAGPEDRLPLPRADELAWRYRGGAPAASSPTLTEAVRDLNLPAEPGVAYVAGEARSVQAVRAHLVRERGWPRRSVLVKPFWTPGKRGME